MRLSAAFVLAEWPVHCPRKEELQLQAYCLTETRDFWKGELAKDLEPPATIPMSACFSRSSEKHRVLTTSFVGVVFVCCFKIGAPPSLVLGSL